MMPQHATTMKLRSHCRRRATIMFAKAVTYFCTASVIFLAMQSLAFTQRPFSRRALPDKVLIGYGSDIDKVRSAVHDGVNVVIWAFVDIVSAKTKNNGPRILQSPTECASPETAITTQLNLTAVQELMEELDVTGFDNVLHLVSFGGWNGPHLDPKLSALEWYQGFREHIGHFHGLDWDLEGNDLLTSPNNLFSIDCLNKMVEISQMAKADGYVISMAPPQSYLDVGLGRCRFSRLVNLTDSQREWHNEFSYYGANVYAYLLTKCSESIDLISIQFYESYSRAAEADVRTSTPPSRYLELYVEELVKNGLMHYVDFSEDAELDMLGTFVGIPLSKLVFGFANGWALPNPKNFFAPIEEVQKAWKALDRRGHVPRGFMFWTINEEGGNGVYMARGLSRILNGAEVA